MLASVVPALSASKGRAFLVKNKKGQSIPTSSNFACVGSEEYHELTFELALAVLGILGNSNQFLMPSAYLLCVSSCSVVVIKPYPPAK